VTDAWDEIRRAFRRKYNSIVRKRLTPEAKRAYHREYMRDYRAEHSHHPEPKARKVVQIPDDLKKRLMAGR
jgi:hypothetical protein